MPTVILSGMREEWDIARSIPGVRAFQGRARDNLTALLPPGTTQIISFGVCGGLSPLLRVGDLVVGALTRAEMALSRTFQDKLPCFHSLIYSSGKEEADTVEERAALFAKTGAWAIDDETRAVAEAARKRNIPYCAIRAVSDDASMTLPLAARRALGPDGNLNLGGFLASLAGNPLQVFDLIKVAGDFGKALDALRRAATVLT